MKFWLKYLFLAVLIGGPATGQEAWDEFEAVWEHDYGAVIGVTVAPDAESPVLLSLDLEGQSNRVLDSGLEIGAVGRVSFQRDHPARNGFSGRVVFDANQPFYQGAFSGLAGGSEREDKDARAQLETGYIYAKGGYGEIRLGRDEGAAKRTSETAPSIFNYASIANPRLDPNGSAMVRTDHDLTGPAAKLSYATPRLLGLEAIASFTPEADTRGVDRDPVRDVSGAGIVIENAAEIGLNLSRRLPQGGARIKAGLGYSQAEARSTRLTEVDDIETWSAGVTVEGETIKIGVSALNSNNGISGRSGDYETWEIGATKSLDQWTFGVAFGAASDDAIGLRSEAWSAGLARRVADGASISLGWISQNQDYRPGISASFSNNDYDSSGIVVEITLSSL